MRNDQLCAVWVGLIVALTATTPIWSWPRTVSQSGVCQADERVVIHSESSCVPSAGIRIRNAPESRLEESCQMNAKVRGLCGQDGHLVRTKAYQKWLTQLRQFEDHCVSNGGRFYFETTGFNEPSNESFCDPAQAIFSVNLFEDPVCNYVSRCPPVAIHCEYPCEDHDVPMQVKVSAHAF